MSLEYEPSLEPLHTFTKQSFSNLNNKQVPDTTWADVGGLEKVKQELMETVSPPNPEALNPEPPTDGSDEGSYLRLIDRCITLL